MPRIAACLAAVGGVTVALVPGSGQAAQGTPTVRVVAEGLNSPRGVTVLGDGTVLVAEAGTGGRGPCTKSTGASETRKCFGNTGSIYRVRGKHQGRVVRNLPSISDPAGREAAGPVDVVVSGDGYLVLSGAALNSAKRAQFGAQARRMGTLYHVGGRWHGSVIADLVEHETRLNPDGVLPPTGPGKEPLHSNPWRFVAAGGDWLVTDAGANDLIRTARGGPAHTELVFPHSELRARGSRAPELAESVPTGIVRGPDGAYYVGELGGRKPGAARIWRIVPGHRPQVFVSGMTSLTDLALDGRGGLVALSMGEAAGSGGAAKPGALYRIDLKTRARSEIPTGGRLRMATGMGIGREGEIYVANNGIGNGAGQLVRVEP
ncbi:ScyD/ScyE family protein [Thermomonospora echinospora]|nr:ScyD/ScyE family protein [Thermomonospora echinospora]